MNWEAMGEVVGAIAVVFTLAYKLSGSFFISLSLHTVSHIHPCNKQMLKR